MAKKVGVNKIYQKDWKKLPVTVTVTVTFTVTVTITITVTVTIVVITIIIIPTNNFLGGKKNHQKSWKK